MVSGKRYSETAHKVAQGRARKRKQEYEKRQAERAEKEVEESKKWEEGVRKVNPKKLLEEQKKQDKLRARRERAELLTAEQEALGVGGKGK
ncbi:Lso1p KNAG_0B05020 [Huiozyma naganishii CBS 8797]|uniref:LSO1/LSO2 domain-containing protein n=1 Tax=Huiozyma naganishii (strain ATCC MYA-139 / BCRC 22969 / CBS 8797 / KCTC 17520 / NBRC 10181 / NCYC 3082 / Yp74L-3) TaxID=1071383 RepID=J7S525_HUIN7|nr:hypothetical protein KNAG_0B05020 [Kazachstania naganishii CBS 8797]CCK68936.1 hypothetical protein KNAG_0B05020 [Kazachstania naganishii CBS 8797]